MARPEVTNLDHWPREQLREHEPFRDPSVNWPSRQEQMGMLGGMVKAALEKRDRGEKLTRLERTLCVGTNNNADRIPTYSFFTDGPCNYYGYTCRQVERDPKLHAEVVERWTEEFGFEALGEGIDTMNTEIEAMGLIRKKFQENAPADVKIRLMDDMDDDEAIEFWEEASDRFNPFTDGRCPRRLELYDELVRRLLKGRGWPVMAAPSSHFAQSVNAIGFKRAFNWMRREPEKWDRAIRAQQRANIKWYKALKSTGVTFFINIDAWNSVPNFRPEQLYKFEKPYMKEVFDTVAPTPVIYFYWGLRLCGAPDENGRGGWVEFLEKSAETGTFVITNLAPDYYTAPSDDLRLYRETANRLGKSYITGIKDEVMLSGTPEEVRAEVRKTIKQLYPCNGGCTIVPNMIPLGTPAENIHAWIRALDDYGTYPIDLEKIEHDEKKAA
jgi:uroporphyrinogen decarboxylase